METLIDIKLATQEDLPNLQKMLNSLLNFERGHFDATLRSDWAYSDEAREKLSKAIERDIVLIAYRQNLPAGYLIGRISSPTPNGARSITQAQVDNIYVEADCRRRHIGEALFGFFEGLCRERNVKRLSVTVLAKNEGAIAFYEEMNFLPRSIIYTREL